MDVDLWRKIEHARKMGNYNLILQYLTDRQNREACRERNSLCELLTHQHVCNVHLSRAHREELPEPVALPPNPPQVIVPVYEQQVQQGALLYPRFQFSPVFYRTEQADKALGDSFQDAYEALLPLLWQISPLVYLDPNNYTYKLTVPGGWCWKYKSEGRSAGLGFVVAMLLAVTKLQLQFSVALTGSVEWQGNDTHQRLRSIPVHKVQHLSAKIEAVLREREDVSMIIVPEENAKEYRRLTSAGSKIKAVPDVQTALEYCFGTDWWEQARPLPKKICKGDPEVFFQQARHVQKYDKKEKRARLMYCALSDYLEDKTDAFSANLCCKTMHRIARTYDKRPQYALKYVNASLERLQKLKAEGMIDDAQEYGNLLTSLAKSLLDTFAYQKAEETNERALKMQPSRLTSMPNIGLKGQIAMARGDAQTAQTAFEQALAIARQAQDWAAQERYHCWRLKLFTLWCQWDQAQKVYQELEKLSALSDHHESRLAKLARMEYLVWARVYGLDIAAQETIEKKLFQAAKGPQRLFFQGLINLEQAQKAGNDFKKSQKAFETLNDSADGKSHIPFWLKDLWSILPLVWGVYARSLAAGHNVLEQKIVSQIAAILKQYELQDLQPRVTQHLEQWQQLGNDLGALRSWCYTWRQLIYTS